MRNQVCKRDGRYKVVSLGIMSNSGTNSKDEPKEKTSIMVKVDNVWLIIARGVMGKPQVVYQGTFRQLEGELCATKPGIHGIGLFWLETYGLSDAQGQEGTEEDFFRGVEVLGVGSLYIWILDFISSVVRQELLFGKGGQENWDERWRQEEYEGRCTVDGGWRFVKASLETNPTTR
jgi:hypothetical protein